MNTINPIHPELRCAVRFMPQIAITQSTLWFMRRVVPLAVKASAREGVHVHSRLAGSVKVRIYQPYNLPANAPVLLWIHGGGHIVGTAAMDDAACARYASDLNALVVAPDYRLAPEHPFPADLDDCHAALAWIHASADELGIDRRRIVIGGASAGGGLAAALIQCVCDEGHIRPAFQLLVYPMLDDRTTLRDDIDETGFRIWSQKSNRYAWSAYLGSTVGVQEVPAYFAPGRRQNLSGLPPAWLGVGTLDLFLDEDRDYARRLREDGVNCTFCEANGAYHGFDILAPESSPARAFYASQLAAMRKALFFGEA